MSDEFPAADIRDIDDSTEKSTTARVGETIRSASQSVNDAIAAGREPGMPLDTLSRMVREAPLPALAVAFMLGVVFARKR